MRVRNDVLTLAVATAIATAAVAARCLAGAPAAPPEHPRPSATVAVAFGEDGAEKTDAGKKHGKDRKEKGDEAEKRDEGGDETEQSVPMNMVPQPVIDAVMKECPGGKITEAELEAKKGKIMWAFDVSVGEAKYDVKITVDGKFHSKKAEAKEEGEHDDKK